jgi:hypothetical protein
LIVENTLAGLENAFVSVREKIERRQTLTDEERATLCLFAAGMHSRTRPAGDHWQQTAQQLHEMVSSMEQQYGTAPTTSRHTRRLVEIAPQYLVMTMLDVQTPLLYQMKMSILVANDELGFITSDSPCVWFNPNAYTLPPFYRSPGLAQRDIEVTLPLTPNHMLFISHRKNQFYIDVGQHSVDQANRLTRAHAADEFVSWKGETRPSWFESGTPPEDAWENTEAGKKAMQQSAEWEQELKEWNDKDRE